MADLLRAGKIRAIGVSNFSPAQMDAFRKVAPLRTAQPPYNLFERAIERDVLPYCRDKKIVTLAYGALCRGLLSGRMTRQTRFAGDDLRKGDPKFQAPRFVQYLEAVQRLRPLRARKLRKACHPSGATLDSRPAGHRRLPFGERGGRSSWPPSATWRVGTSTIPPWPKSIAFCRRRS